MNIKHKALTALGAGSIVVASSVVAIGVGASDHLDAPGVKADGRTDLNDLYAFQSPTNPDNTVLVMTVNPLAGVVSGTTFHPKATYRFNIDNNGDAKADTKVDVKFGKVRKDGSQKLEVEISGSNGEVEGEGRVGKQVAVGSDGKAMAGTFDDPFFFDLDGFKHGFQFTGTDFFAGLNVTAIVVEVPSSLLGDGGIGVWATTSVKGKVVDQVGRPAINTALIAADRKDAFNTTPPAQQWAAFGAEVTARITALSGDAAYADTIAHVLIPDILTFEIGNSAGFLNGRQLADDVIDTELSVLTKEALGTDGVSANDAVFSGIFPYLAPAN
ncbi:MAG: DUF4331 family protein [Ilumatobacteraceae bacterium]